MPASWKTANVTPILKSGDPSVATNYRPISLLSLVSKVLERIIHPRISKFLYANNLLSNCQFGFRPHSSTQEALLHVTNAWHNQLASNHQVAAVFFDAFDSIPHGCLIKGLVSSLIMCVNIHMHSGSCYFLWSFACHLSCHY